MLTKYSHWDIRRRHHGELIERAVISEMIGSNKLEPILKWDGLIRHHGSQPYFMTRNGSSECHLDEFGWLRNETGDEMRSCIIEIKAMRLIDWNEWNDHHVLHIDKANQRVRHLKICKEYGFDGVAFIAVNKDSSEMLIRAYDADGDQLFEYME